MDSTVVDSNSGQVAVYIGKIPKAVSLKLIDSLLDLFRPQLCGWRRMDNPTTKEPMAFGFADFTDAAAADTFRRVFEALEVPGDDEKGLGPKNVRFLVKVEAAAEALINESTERSMSEIAARMRDEERRRIASLPPGMDESTADDATIQEKAKQEYLKDRDAKFRRMLDESQRVMKETLAMESSKKSGDERSAEEEEQEREKRIRLEKLAQMDKEEALDAIGHGEREKKRINDRFEGHEKRYYDRERERFRRITNYRNHIWGFPACKRTRTLSAIERKNEKEKDDLDREEELRELEEAERERELKEHPEHEKEAEPENAQTSSDSMVDDDVSSKE